MSDVAAVNLRWALVLVDCLVAAGVKRVVISPGSRSTPLTLACLRHPGLRSWVQVDERSAAFFALGLAKADQQPVALVCTSGSAPANWFPAVIEANQGMHPLLLLTADRPPELRDCGANQTIDQLRLFGSQVRASHELPCARDDAEALRGLRFLAARAVDQSRWPLPGPVHVNIPLQEPLVPMALPGYSADALPMPVSYPILLPSPGDIEALAKTLSGRPGLIVCGEGRYGPEFAAALAQLAQAVDCPVLADPLSGLRFGGHDRSRILGRYDAFLRSTRFRAAHRPDWVLRFGAMPVSKVLLQYLEDCHEAAHLLVEEHGRWPDPLHHATRLLRADARLVCVALAEARLQPAPLAWREDFVAAEERAGAWTHQDEKPLEAEVIETLLRHLPADACLFSANSMAIRDLDSFAAGGELALRIVGNRGASGIDGNVSTALGLAAGQDRPVVALLGDLALYHDMNGLLAARGMDVTFVVFNNGGGGIFSYLAQAGLADFERAWLTPTGLDLSHAARMYGLDFQRVNNGAEFGAALSAALSHKGPDLIEVMIEREGSVARHRAYWAAQMD